MNQGVFPYPPPSQKAVQFHIKGMDCPSCAHELEAALCHVPDIHHASVHFTTATLDVTTESGKLPDIECLNAKTRKFGIHLVHKESASHLSPFQWWNNQKVHILTGMSSLFLLAYGGGFLKPNLSRHLWIAAIGISLIPFVGRALLLIKEGRSPFSIHLLVSLAACGALLLGEYAEAAAVVWLFTLGEILESLSAEHARYRINYMATLHPETATLEEGGYTRTVSAHELKAGQNILVKVGDKVPADAILCEGRSEFDQSPLTGESRPTPKGPSDTIYAGTTNISQPVKATVHKTGDETALAKIVQLAETAHRNKAPIVRTMESFAAYYTPVIILLAILVTVLPPLFFERAWDAWIYKGLTLLLVACPCALVLSTPTAIAAGLSTASRHHILLKSGAALEALRTLTTIAFDKTGTLTQSIPRLVDIIPVTKDQQEILRLAAALERGSSHPLGAAIVRAAHQQNLDIPSLDTTPTQTGHTLSGTVNQQRLTIGSVNFVPDWDTLDRQIHTRITRAQNTGQTVVALCTENRTLGLLMLQTDLRPEAADTLDHLAAMNIQSVVLTGDTKDAATHLFQHLNLTVHADLSPQDKLEVLSALREKRGPIGMVGDGINDAPALAAATVGIAIHDGTPLHLTSPKPQFRVTTSVEFPF